MEELKKAAGQKKTSSIIASKIKNQDLVVKRQLHIAKKASKLFLKKGYHQTSIREITEATGLGVGHLYNYIKRKEDVLYLVFDVCHQALLKYLEKQGVYKIEDPQVQIRSFVWCLLDNAKNFRDEIAFIYRDSWALPSVLKEEFMQKEMHLISELEKIIKRGNEQGIFRIENPFFTASMIIYQSSIEPLRGWTFRGTYSKEDVQQMTIDYILKPIGGIGP